MNTKPKPNPKTLRFRPYSAAVEKARTEAHRQGWTRMAGMQEWAREQFNARLYFDRVGDWTCMRFQDEQQMTLFLLKYGPE